MKMGQLGLVDGLFVAHERKREVKNDSKALNLSKWKESLDICRNQKAGEEGWGGCGASNQRVWFEMSTGNAEKAVEDTSLDCRGEAQTWELSGNRWCLNHETG